MRTYYVYILASHSGVLYTGVTADLITRLHQHRTGRPPGFASRYRAVRLVYFEVTPNVRAAIAREKQIKSWRREKKLRLIESMNPGWLDLAADWFPKESLSFRTRGAGEESGPRCQWAGVRVHRADSSGLRPSE
ncbi:MAG: GIY-YIG nuclease family protein [Gemmatimonadota bacterium]